MSFVSIHGSYSYKRSLLTFSRSYFVAYMWCSIVLCSSTWNGLFRHGNSPRIRKISQNFSRICANSNSYSDRSSSQLSAELWIFVLRPILSILQPLIVAVKCLIMVVEQKFLGIHHFSFPPLWVFLQFWAWFLLIDLND